MNKLSTDDFLLLFYDARIKHASSSEPIPELKPDSLEGIEYAFSVPFENIYGEETYKSFEEKAAILFYLLIKRHYLLNGNKRIAWMCLKYFCKKNHVSFHLSNKKMVAFCLKVANSKEKKKSLAYIKNFLKRHIIKMADSVAASGVLVGPTDINGRPGISAQLPSGKPIRLGGGEIIMNELASTKHCEKLSEMNEETGGKPFDCELQKVANTDRASGNMPADEYHQENASAGAGPCGMPTVVMYDLQWWVDGQFKEIVQYAYPAGYPMQYARQKPIAVAKWIAAMVKDRYTQGEIWAVQQGNPYARIQLSGTKRADKGEKINKMENPIVTHVQYKSVILESVGSRNYLRYNGDSWSLTDDQLKVVLTELEKQNQNPLSAANYLIGLDKSEFKRVSKPVSGSSGHMTEADEVVNTKAAALANLAEQYQKGESMGVKQMYEDTARALGATDEEIELAQGMPWVEVIFDDPRHNYTSSVSRTTTEQQAKEYFIGKTFNVGQYPKEVMKKAIDIKFHPAGSASFGIILNTNTSNNISNNMKNNFGNLYYLQIGNTFSESGKKWKLAKHTKDGIVLLEVSNLVPSDKEESVPFDTVVATLDDKRVTIEGCTYEKGGRDTNALLNEIELIRSSFRCAAMEEEVAASGSKIAGMVKSHKATMEAVEAMADKGARIPNNYADKTPEQVWNGWNKAQREHFLYDHHREEVDIFGYHPYDKLPEKIKQSIKGHMMMGSYSGGGPAMDHKIYLNNFIGRWAAAESTERETGDKSGRKALELEYEQYLNKHSLPKLSADELLYELKNKETTTNRVRFSSGAQIKKLVKKKDYWHAKMHTTKGIKRCAVPAWGTTLAKTVDDRARITTCQDKQGKWYVENVIIKAKGVSKKQAKEIAEKVASKINNK